MNTAGMSQGILQGMEAIRNRNIEDRKLAYEKKLQDQYQEDRTRKQAEITNAGTVADVYGSEQAPLAPPPVQPQMGSAPAMAPGAPSTPRPPVMGAVPPPSAAPQMQPQSVTQPPTAAPPMQAQAAGVPSVSSQSMGVKSSVSGEMPSTQQNMLNFNDVARILHAKGVPPEQWMGTFSALSPAFDMQSKQQLEKYRIEMAATAAGKAAYAEVRDKANLEERAREADMRDQASRTKIDAGKVTELTDNGRKVLEEFVAAGLSLPGGGSASVSERNKMLNDMGEKEVGGAGSGELAKSVATAKSERVNLTNMSKAVSNVRAYNGLVDSQIKVAKDLIKAITSTDASLLNKPINSIITTLGDSPKTAEYLTQLRLFQDEAAKLLSSGQNIGGVLTNQSRMEMQKIINGSTPLDSAIATFERIRKDGDSRVSEYEKEKERTAQAAGRKAPLINSDSSSNEEAMSLDDYLKSKGH